MRQLVEAAGALKKPTVFATLNFGGMLRHKSTWSPIACPSTIDPLLLAQPARNFPISFRSDPKITFFRYFGTITT